LFVQAFAPLTTKILPKKRGAQIILSFFTKSYSNIFFHPDYTVGPGITPDLPKRLAGFTAGKEFHLSPKIYEIEHLL